MPALKAAFYAKNLPAWERVTRVALSAAVVVYGLTLPTPWSWGLFASAVGLAVTGLFGFCPACAMIGRRSSNQPVKRQAETPSRS